MAPEPHSINIEFNEAARRVLRPTEHAEQQDLETPAKRTQAQQQGAQFMQSGMQGQSTDPDYIHRMEMFEGVQHPEIYKHAQEMNPGAMHSLADAWVKMSDELSGGLMGMHIAIQKELASGIEGQMADAALATAQKFYTQAHDVQDVIASCGHRVKAAAHAAELIKMTVPPPAGPMHSAAVPDVIDGMQVAISAQMSGIASDSDSIEVAYQKGADALHRAAIDAMNNHYKPSYAPAGSGIPAFVPVSVPGDGGHDSDDGGGYNPGISGPGPSNPNAGGTDSENPAGTENNSDPTQSDETPGTTPASASDQAANQPGNQRPDAGSGTSVTGTRPAGFDASSGGGGHTPGGGLSSGFRRPGSDPGSAGRGHSVAGGPGIAASARPAAVGATSAGPGKPGMSGMPGMGAPGSKKQEDAEHKKTPDYLIMDREEELIGRIDPAVPGAIGGDIPAAQPARDTGREPR